MYKCVSDRPKRKKFTSCLSPCSLCTAVCHGPGNLPGSGYVGPAGLPGGHFLEGVALITPNPETIIFGERGPKSKNFTKETSKNIKTECVCVCV